MFYMMPNPLLDNALQSWIAASRDQATAQLIATVSMQKAMQSRVSHDLESCALMVEEQVNAVYHPVARAPERTCPAKRGRKHGL